MKFLGLLIIAVSSLIVNISANNVAVPYEVLYYFYVYKMEFNAGLPLLLAPDCRSPTGTICFFDDFLKFIMEERFTNRYKPKPADHTMDPGEGNLQAVKQAISGIPPPGVRYEVDRLLPEIKDATQTALIKGILKHANAALNTGRVSTSDARNALAAVQMAETSRYKDCGQGLTKWLKKKCDLEPAEKTLIALTNGLVNWDQTVENINNSKLPQARQEIIKERLKDPVARAAKIAPRYDRNHINILQSLQDTVTQIQPAIDRITGGPQVPPAATILPQC